MKRHFEDGQTMDSSRPSELLETTDSMTSIPSRDSNQLHPTKRNRSSTQESLQLNKRKRETYSDSVTTSNPNTLNTNSLQTSDQDSTSKDKDSKRFWNSHSKEISEKLWLCTRTDWLDSA